MSLEPAPSPGRGRSQAAVAFATLKRQIVTCALPPGAEVSEANLALRFGLGRTPVREALTRLTAERLVRVRPRRGYVVAPIILADVVNAFAIRTLLEPEAAAQAAGRLDTRALRHLEELARSEYDRNDPDSVTAFLGTNTEFHVAVAQASGNARLADILAGLLQELERLFHASLRLRDRSAELVHEHGKLLHALLAGDRKMARAEALAQIRAAQRMVLETLISNEGLADTDVELA